MKKSNVYTRTGDAGQTSLVSGTRVDKCDCRIDAYGTIDELNSSLGVVLSFDGQTSDEAAAIIRFIQHRLFSLGAYLADDRKIESCYVTADDIARIEAAIDEIDAQLPPLRQFLLPAGCHAAAAAHMARTIARRAERLMVGLSKSVEIKSEALKFVNRISDLMFVVARQCNIKNDVDEIFWSKDC